MTGFADSLPFFGSAVSQLFGAEGAGAVQQGDLAAAAGYEKAMKIAFTNAHLSTISGNILNAQLGRKINMATGKVESQVAASGFTQGGSAGDVLRMSAMEGGLAKAVQSVNNELKTNSYRQQGEAFAAQAAQMQGAAAQAGAAKGGGMFGAAFSAVGGLFSLFSDDRLKRNIELLEEREDGINIYTFEFAGTEDLRWRGVLAQEVQRFKPWCVVEAPNGFLMVDYAKLGLEHLMTGAPSAEAHTV